MLAGVILTVTLEPSVEPLMLAMLDALGIVLRAAVPLAVTVP